MTKKIFVQNTSLSREQRQQDPIIDVYNLEGNELASRDWLYSNLWPKKKFERVIDYIRNIHPLSINEGEDIWDINLQGYAIYNHSIKEYNQSIEEIS